jgi:hypothetical protein
MEKEKRKNFVSFSSEQRDRGQALSLQYLDFDIFFRSTGKSRKHLLDFNPTHPFYVHIGLVKRKTFI